MNAGENKPRTMPKGGRKGGSIFPRVALSDALGHAKKLVTKTHTSRIPIDVLYSGVVGAKSGLGAVKTSAIKQYGLLVGDQKSLFVASELAKKIAAAPPEEVVPLYRLCALRPAVFKSLSQTFHGDTVSKAKLRQRASELKVHPEETDTCVDMYVSTMLTAQLITVDGEQVTHLTLDTERPPTQVAEQGEEEDGQGEQADFKDQDNAGEPDEESAPIPPRSGAPKAVITVNVTLDSTTDSEKLAKQLALLRKYGAL